MFYIQEMEKEMVEGKRPWGLGMGWFLFLAESVTATCNGTGGLRDA